MRNKRILYIFEKKYKVNNRSRPNPLEFQPQVKIRAVICEFLPARHGIETLEAKDDAVLQPAVDPEIHPADGPQTAYPVPRPRQLALERVGNREPLALPLPRFASGRLERNRAFHPDPELADGDHLAVDQFLGVVARPETAPARRGHGRSRLGLSASRRPGPPDANRRTQP